MIKTIKKWSNNNDLIYYLYAITSIFLIIDDYFCYNLMQNINNSNLIQILLYCLINNLLLATFLYSSNLMIDDNFNENNFYQNVIILLSIIIMLLISLTIIVVEFFSIMILFQSFSFNIINTIINNIF